MKQEHTPFDNAMFGIYYRAKKEAAYNATLFLNMISSQPGLSVAKQLINAPKVSVGYAALYEKGRLDLTVEAMVVESLEWRDLFEPEELARAERRLREYHYTPKAPS
ncbi:hypothetical protein [uncultured Methylobacterium sp.]|uniref:hypothetical protein n=1 Tax=uncultured Methylobacterium sp. TaxID=157278 RepID=UPI0025963544|nr:hypothetical protein [uncultured Methylobacterium sp.]